MTGISGTDYLVLTLILAPCAVFILRRARRLLAKGGGCGSCSGGSGCGGKKVQGMGGGA